MRDLASKTKTEGWYSDSQSLGPTWQKEKTKSGKLFSDVMHILWPHMHILWSHMHILWPHMHTYTVIFILENVKGD